jgi:hypothetical protein
MRLYAQSALEQALEVTLEVSGTRLQASASVRWTNDQQMYGLEFEGTSDEQTHRLDEAVQKIYRQQSRLQTADDR